VIGSATHPSGWVRRGGRGCGPTGDLAVDYVGLTHLGWLTRRCGLTGSINLPRLLADDAALAGIKEVRLMRCRLGSPVTGALPNVVLY